MSVKTKPVAVLKRRSSSRSTNYKLCVFCQASKTEQTRNATTESKKKVKDCIAIRRKCRDDSNSELLDRLESIDDASWELGDNIKWHKNCHGAFTSATNIKRVEKRFKEQTSEKDQAGEKEPSSRGQIKRRLSVPVDWSKCMFCQKVENKQTLHNVQTLEKSSNIIAQSQHDAVMRVRLSDINDLIAAEGKYHLKCLVQFQRNTAKEGKSADVDDNVMHMLLSQLQDGLGKGHVFDMKAVWDTYINLSNKLGVQIPSRYISRRQTFYVDVKQKLGSQANFVRPLGVTESLLMYPGDSSDFVISYTLSKEPGLDLFAPSSESECSEESSDDEPARIDTSSTGLFQEMVHVALRLRADLDATPGHNGNWRNIDQSHIEEIVPNSLFLFLILVFGGMSAIEDFSDVSDENTKRRVLSVAQDIVYGVSKGTKLTPKHIGLGLTLHQATRSEKLVNLVHAAYHCIPVRKVRQFDNAIANTILEQYKANGYNYIPPNVSPGIFTHFSCDNIDVLECTLDGKNTFHSTQMVAWQRDSGQPSSENISSDLDNMQEDKETMQVYQTLDKANVICGKRPSPPNMNNCNMNAWLREDNQQHATYVHNLAWTVTRRANDGTQHVPPWNSFNEAACTVNRPITKACMMPILQAPADEFDTITTLINKFMGISKEIGQTHTVITADQPLYSKGKELVWQNQQTLKNVIFVMGGLHICFNFLRAIGQHMECSGLEDIWIETGVFGPNTVFAVLDGKTYYRAVRGHQLTYEDLWRIKWRYFFDWVRSKKKGMSSLEVEINEVELAFANTPKREDVLEATTKLTDRIFATGVTDLLHEYESEMMKIKNFAYWHSYMEMVEILLSFIKAQRTGNWLLHVETFAAMLPWLTVYDHTNYARWGPVYLSDMKALPQTAPEVYNEFLAGNFVVKRSENKFNEVPTDQATEWINKVCKTAGGIIGITRNDQARDRFCITWARRSQVSNETLTLFGLLDDEEETNDNKLKLQPTRINVEENLVKIQIKLIASLDVFGLTTYSRTANESNYESKLISVATKDVASDEITSDLLTCAVRGRQLVEEFAVNRLKEKTVEFFAPIKRVKSKTFSDLYKKTTPDRQKMTKLIRADRRLLQRLFNAANSGRSVQTAEVLQHELAPVPLSLANVSGNMNTTTKSQILNVLTADLGIETPQALSPSDKATCMVIDGHALVQALSKPPKCQTFGDYAQVFLQSVFKHFNDKTTRVDVTFDRYYGGNSIKNATRSKRSGKRRPIRKLITGPEVPLPQVWEQFITLDENKSDLAGFLSSELLQRAEKLPSGSTLVTGGGCTGNVNAKSSSFNADHLSVQQEEADTRIVIHAKDAVARGYERVVVQCRDTDVLLLLIYHLGCEIETWMVSGTSKNKRCFPVHVISQKLTADVKANILGFHALTGCDTTSSFSGIGKKACWKKFCENPVLLSPIGHGGDIGNVEKFMCGLYGCNPETHEPSIDVCRYRLFLNARKSLELLPPTKDAFALHVKRAAYQAMIWMKAADAEFEPEDPTNIGCWFIESGVLKPVWMSKPSVPVSCLQLVACGCTTKCSTSRCKCYKSGQICMFECKCEASGCANPVGNEDD